MLVDTDVLIWHLRGLPKATQRLDQLPALTISAITWMELLQGFRNKAEMLAVQESRKRAADPRMLTAIARVKALQSEAATASRSGC